MRQNYQNLNIKTMGLCRNSALILFTLFCVLAFPLCLSFLPHLVGIIGLGGLLYSKKSLITPNKSIFIAIGLIVLLTFSCTLWAFQPEASFNRAVKISLSLVLFLPMIFFLKNISDETISKIRNFVIWPFLIVGSFLLIELVFNFPILNLFKQVGQDDYDRWMLNKHIAAFFLLSPLAIFLQKDKKTTSVLALYALLIGIFLTTASQSVQLAALVMMGCVVGLKVIPKIISAVCFITASFLLIVMPFISTLAFNFMADKIGDEGILRRASAAQRLEIWDFISQKIMDHPLFGMGLDATRHINFHGHKAYYKSDTVLHPHNISLQIWLELGALGIVCACFILYLIYKSMKNVEPLQKLYCLIIFSGSFTILMASWSIWASWLFGLMMFSMALCQIKLQKPLI